MLFNQKQIYERAKELFEERGFDTSFGSNIQQIQNSMQYLVSMLNQNTQINARETILSSQTKRNMILEGARLLGYEAIPKRSFQYSITIQVKNSENTPQIFNINTFDVFKSNNNTYFYLGEPLSIPIEQGQTEEIVINVKEGDLKRQIDNPSLNYVVGSENDMLPTGFVDIPFNNIEEDGIALKSTFQGNTFVWKKSDSNLLNNFNKEYVREDDVHTGYPRVYFRYGGWGHNLELGTNIQIDIMISKGSNGQADGNFEAKDYQNFVVEVIDSKTLISGTDEESNQSIKNNAPIFNNQSNRIVTIHDYKTIQGRQPNVHDAQIWDGTDELQRLVGQIYFSFVPGTASTTLIDTFVNNNPYGNPIKDYRWVLNNYGSQDNFMLEAQVNNIFDHIKQYSIPTLEFNYREPIYLDFDIRVKMQQYNQQQPTVDQNNDIFSAVDMFFRRSQTEQLECCPDKDIIERFDQKYFNSDLIDFVVDRTVQGTMFDIEPNTSVLLKSNQIIKDSSDEGNIVISLGLDFMPFLDGDIVQENLVDISTENILQNRNLIMPSSYDFYSISNEYEIIYEAELLLGDFIIGLYRVYPKTRSVEIVIFADDSNIYSRGDDTTSVDTISEQITSQLQNEGIRIKLKFPSPNIQVRKNTYPRLNSVDIITGDAYLSI